MEQKVKVAITIYRERDKIKDSRQTLRVSVFQRCLMAGKTLNSRPALTLLTLGFHGDLLEFFGPLVDLFIHELNL